MSDEITAKNESKFKPHPAGQFVAVCVDTISLGEKVDSGPNFPDKLSPKCALVFRTGEKNAETGDIVDIAQEYTVSMGDKANLRKALESWRGKPYTQDQIDEGVPLHKLTGQPAYIGVAHKTSKNGRVYAFVQSMMPVPRGAQPPVFPEYRRADFWADRKKEYAEAAKKFRAANAAAPSDDDFAPPLPDDADDLPF